MKSRKKAFSLVELLVAVSVMALVSAAVSPMISSYLEDIKVEKTIAFLNEVNEALGTIAVRQASVAFIQAGDNEISGAFTDDEIKNDFYKFISKPEAVDAFGNELRVYSTYDDLSLTGVVVIYAYGDETVSVGETSLSVMKRGDESVAVYLFRN